MITDKPYVLTDIKKTTKDVTTFTFKAQDGTSINFSPGMFAMVSCIDPGTGQKISRAYSIANAPPSGELQFFISMIGGQFTSKLANAKVGDVYYVSAPYGQFKLEGTSEKPLFLAGGTGLVPFFSMLRFMINSGTKPDFVLLYSARYEYDIIERQQLEEMVAKLGGKLVITLTREDPASSWKGERGRIDANMINRHVLDAKDRIGYICGPPEFAKALRSALIGIGVDEKRIKAEMWG